MSKMESLTVATLLNSIGLAVLCMALLGGKMYAEGAVEVNNTSTLTSTTSPIITSPNNPNDPLDSEGYPMVPIPKSEQYTKPCRLSLNNYVYTAIVAHNMNKFEAQILHKKNREFKELTQNLTDTIMSFADQVGKIMYMFNTCTEPPIDIIVPSTQNDPAATSHSEITVLSLLIIILALSCYIGYLSYKLKTKYYHNSNILIEDHH